MSFKRLIKYFSLFLTLGINISIANTNTNKKVGLNFLTIDYDSPTTTDIIFEPTDPFDVVSVIKEDGTIEKNTIPYILLLKGIIKDKEKTDRKKLMVVLDVASLFLGVGEFKAALTSTTALAKAYRAALASADLAATTTDVACQDSDSEVCEQWKEISGFVLAGVISASSIDLTYQSFKNSPKMQNRVMGLRDAEGVGKVGSKVLDDLTTTLLKSGEDFTILKNARKLAGNALGNGKQINGKWLRGTHRNAGLFPKSITDKLKGRSFNNFGEFRKAFWKEVANEPNLSKQFTPDNINRMKKGAAPQADPEQWLGKTKSYILHHKTPINQGGKVYDADNLYIVTPKYHKEILNPAYHYGYGY